MKKYLTYIFIIITVASCKKDDTVIFTVNPQTPRSLIPTKFSTKRDGYIYNWDFGDGNTGKGKEVVHSFNLKGIYTVKLTLDGQEAMQFITVE